jgi:hypothetical protein
LQINKFLKNGYSRSPSRKTFPPPHPPPPPPRNQTPTAAYILTLSSHFLFGIRSTHLPKFCTRFLQPLCVISIVTSYSSVCKVYYMTCIGHTLAIPQFGRSAAGFYLREPGFVFKPVHVILDTDKVPVAVAQNTPSNDREQ